MTEQELAALLIIIGLVFGSAALGGVTFGIAQIALGAAFSRWRR